MCKNNTLLEYLGSNLFVGEVKKRIDQSIQLYILK